MKKSKQIFIDLLGAEVVKRIETNNWVEFNSYDNEYSISFMQQDNLGDIVIHCEILYNKNTKKFEFSNCIDSPDKSFKDFEELKQHYNSIEDKIISNGFPFIRF